MTPELRQQISLQLSNQPDKEMATQLNRPSPSHSATQFPIGYEMKGNDGRMWKVTANSNGVQRWVPSGSIVSTTLSYKFNVGDKVKVIVSGSGVGPEDISKEVTIVERGTYSAYPGYRVDPPIGNSMPTSQGHAFFNGMIAEESFELVDTFQQDIEQVIKQSINRKPLKMAKTKCITKRTTKEVRQIETSLINKEEVFKMLALAEATGLPLLLVGDPGVAKTKTIIEYAKAWLNKDGKMTAEDFANKMYILETDEGTKASEIKGMPDLGKLFTENKYEMNAPIAEADIVVINEVDKAGSAIRNAMLGVMNEKFLFNGKHKIPCKWKLFVATCNEIPKDEVNSPFWDRFMLKMTVNRVSAGEMSKYYEKGGRNYREKFNIGIPSKDEINSVEISSVKLNKYLEVAYSKSSDRTLTFVPNLAKAVSYIWDFSMDGALTKTAEIMIGSTAGSDLRNKLQSNEVRTVISKVEMLRSHNTSESLELAIAEIESLINAFASRGQMDEEQVLEIEHTMSIILQNHPAHKQPETTEEFKDL